MFDSLNIPYDSIRKLILTVYKELDSIVRYSTCWLKTVVKKEETNS